MIKAAFFDIDGTLLSHNTNSVPESAVSAIGQLRSKGVLVFLATGRHLAELRQLRPLQGMRFDGAVTLNGQYCWNDAGVICDCPIPREDVRTIVSFLDAHPFPCIFVEEDAMYINFHNARVEQVQAAIHSAMPALGDLRRGYTHNIYQIILYMNEDELRQMPKLKHVKYTRWHDGGVDLIPASGGKAVGVQKVLAHYGIAREETIAFGDGENDVDMFGAVGIAVAMGNACARAKEACDYVTGSADEDGIAHALAYFHVL